MARMAGMAEEFMTNWQSAVFRDKCAAQIDQVRSKINPNPSSEDPMEMFFAQNSTVELEEFVFNKSKTREDYVSLIAEMVMMMRQHGGKPPGVTDEGLEKVKQEAKAAETKKDAKKEDKK